MEPVNERALVERCRRGDEGAFQELVDRYRHLVFALIARTVADASRADGLAQEVFLRVHRGLPYFRGEARLSTWILRIVANVSLGETQPAGAGGTVPAERSQPAGPSEARDRLERAVAKLPPNARLLIAGYRLEGVRDEDLAEALQVPLETVKTMVYGARRQLRHLLQMEPR